MTILVSSLQLKGMIQEEASSDPQYDKVLAVLAQVIFHGKPRGALGANAIVAMHGIVAAHEVMRVTQGPVAHVPETPRQ